MKHVIVSDRSTQHLNGPTAKADASVDDRKDLSHKSEENRAKNHGHPVVELKSLSKHYTSGNSRVAVLNELSLEVPENALSVVIGRSGSGKSTLLNVLAGIDAADSGEIFISGKPLAGLSNEELARFRLEHIGLVFQFFNLLPALTLLENVSLPAELAGNSRKEADERARDLLERVGIAHLEKQLPSQVSGGEMQRAAVARALVNRPKLVLADEPTGNLDEQTAIGVLELFLSLARAEATSLLVVTHDERLITGADHCFFLEQGKITESPSRR